jgi:metal-responsive CopG/Arc/MetJ family transcriptional regulator
MKLPKARITLDLEHDLLNWLMKEVQRTGKSRNEVIGDIIRETMEKRIKKNS